MIDDQSLTDALVKALPPRLHPDIPVLAEIIAAACDGRTTGVATENLQAAIQILQGQTLHVLGGDIRVGNITGEGIAIGHGAQSTVIRIYVPRTAEQQRDWRNRSRMLEKVRTVWVTGLLQPSLHKVALIELGMHYYPDALEHSWEAIVQNPDRPRTPVPPGTSITDVFDESGSELLILGTPGTGKTTLLLELTRELIARAQQDETHAMPVVFNLSTWAVKRMPLANWLVAELNTHYDVSRKLAQAWIANDQVLPLLDGLDEVRLDVRQDCLAAINAYRQEHGLVGMVVCSRLADYEALTLKLRLQGAVVLQPLTAQQIEDALQKLGDQAGRVRTVLENLRDTAQQHDDTTAQALLHTPLLLNIATLAYYGDAAADNTLPPPDVPPDVQQRHLFATYVERMFQRRSKSQHYTPEQSRHWLCWLAGRMLDHSQTIFHLYGLQPDWLAASYQRQVYRLCLVVSLAGGVAILSGSILSIFTIQRFAAPTAIFVTIATSVVIGLVAAIYGHLRPTIEPIESITWSRAMLFQRIIGSAPEKFGPPDGESAVWWYVRVGLWLLVILPTIFGAGFGGGFWGGMTIGGVILWLADSWQLVTLGDWATYFVLGTGVMGCFVGAATLSGVTCALLGLDRRSVTRSEQRADYALRRTARYALWLGGAVFATIFLLFMLYLGVFTFTASDSTLLVLFGVFFSATMALLAWLQYGGLTLVQHYLLRLLCGYWRWLPWRPIRFLDYASERILLHKVGNSYIFVHRILMEYFAELRAVETRRRTDAHRRGRA